MKEEKRMPEHTKGVDETPESFDQLKPPGYWNGERFVEVRMLTDEEAEERYEQLWEWFGESTEYDIPEKFRPRRQREHTPEQ